MILKPSIGSDSISSATINSIRHQKKKLLKIVNTQTTFTCTEEIKLKKKLEILEQI